MSRGLTADDDGVIPPGSFDRCWCTGVTRAEVRTAFTGGARSVESVIRQTQACTGCRTCRPELEQFLRELTADAAERGETASTPVTSPPA